MSSESIDKIITALSGLGADAKEGFIVYIVAWVIYGLLCTLFTSATIVVVVKLLTSLIRYIVHSLCASGRLRQCGGFSADRDGTWYTADIEVACGILQKYKRGLLVDSK